MKLTAHATVSTTAETVSVAAQVAPAGGCPAVKPTAAFELGLSQPVQFLAGDPVATSAVTAPSTSTVADNAATAAVQIALVDKFGNLVPNLAGVTIAVTGGAGNVVTINTSTSACPATGTCATIQSDASGLVKFGVRSTSSGTKTVSVSAPKVTTTGAVALTPFTLQFVGGVPVDANSTLTTNRPSTVSGVAAAATLTVSLRDGSTGRGLYPGPTP